MSVKPVTEVSVPVGGRDDNLFSCRTVEGMSNSGSDKPGRIGS